MVNYCGRYRPDASYDLGLRAACQDAVDRECRLANHSRTSQLPCKAYSHLLDCSAALFHRTSTAHVGCDAHERQQTAPVLRTHRRTLSTAPLGQGRPRSSAHSSRAAYNSIEPNAPNVLRLHTHRTAPSRIHTYNEGCSVASVLAQ